MIKSILKFVSILFLFSCSNVDFDAPHPSDQKLIHKMDSEFIGKYYYIDSVIGKKGDEQFFNSKYFSSIIDNQDSIILFSADLTVTPELISYSLGFTAFYKIEKVDTSRLNKKFKRTDVYIKEKYLIHTENYADTLLDLNGNDKLFFYENRYYLNHKKRTISDLRKEKSWEIYQFEKCNLSLFSLNTTNDQHYQLLFDTTKTWKPIFPVAHLSNKQFKRFVEKGGFQQKHRLLKYPANSK